MEINYNLFKAWAIVCLIGSIIGCIMLADGGSEEYGAWTLAIFGAIFVILVDWLFAKLFARVAIMKGHGGREYFWLCFIFGIMGYLLVIALPNKNVGDKSSVVSEISESLPEL